MRTAAKTEAPAADPEEERRLLEIQEAEAAVESERACHAFEDAGRRWLETTVARAAEKGAAATAEEEARAAKASTRKEVISPHYFHAPFTKISYLAIV